MIALIAALLFGTISHTINENYVLYPTNKLYDAIQSKFIPGGTDPNESIVRMDEQTRLSMVGTSDAFFQRAFTFNCVGTRQMRKCANNIDPQAMQFVPTFNNIFSDQSFDFYLNFYRIDNIGYPRRAYTNLPFRISARLPIDLYQMLIGRDKDIFDTYDAYQMIGPRQELYSDEVIPFNAWNKADGFRIGDYKYTGWYEGTIFGSSSSKFVNNVVKKDTDWIENQFELVDDWNLFYRTMSDQFRLKKDGQTWYSDFAPYQMFQTTEGNQVFYNSRYYSEYEDICYKSNDVPGFVYMREVSNWQLLTNFPTCVSINSNGVYQKVQPTTRFNYMDWCWANTALALIDTAYVNTQTMPTIQYVHKIFHAKRWKEATMKYENFTVEYHRSSEQGYETDGWYAPSNLVADIEYEPTTQTVTRASDTYNQFYVDVVDVSDMDVSLMATGVNSNGNLATIAIIQQLESIAPWWTRFDLVEIKLDMLDSEATFHFKDLSRPGSTEYDVVQVFAGNPISIHGVTGYANAEWYAHTVDSKIMSYDYTCESPSNSYPCVFPHPYCLKNGVSTYSFKGVMFESKFQNFYNYYDSDSWLEDHDYSSRYKLYGLEGTSSQDIDDIVMSEIFDLETQLISIQEQCTPGVSAKNTPCGVIVANNFSDQKARNAIRHISTIGGLGSLGAVPFPETWIMLKGGGQIEVHCSVPQATEYLIPFRYVFELGSEGSYTNALYKSSGVQGVVGEIGAVQFEFNKMKAE